MADFRKDTAALLAGYDQRAQGCDDMLRTAFFHNPEKFLKVFDKANARKFRRLFRQGPPTLLLAIENAIYLHGMGVLLQRFLEWTNNEP